MTYLDVVNNILKRLREQTVATVDATPYSKLIGILVNDAKHDIENAWKWSALRTTLTAQTQEDLMGYVMLGSGNTLEVLDVINDTTDVKLKYMPQAEMTKRNIMQDKDKGAPTHYSFNGTSIDGDTIIEFYPMPDGVYNIRINIVDRSEEYTSDDDIVLLPSQPLVLLAYAKALEERGEDGGASTSRAFANADRSISDHIALDVHKHPEEVIWDTI